VNLHFELSGGSGSDAGRLPTAPVRISASARHDNNGDQHDDTLRGLTPQLQHCGELGSLNEMDNLQSRPLPLSAEAGLFSAVRELYLLENHPELIPPSWKQDQKLAADTFTKVRRVLRGEEQKRVNRHLPATSEKVPGR
jgi:hypothetical protein